MWENMFCFYNINKYMNNTFRLMDDLTGNITYLHNRYLCCSKLIELTRHTKSEGEGHIFSSSKNTHSASFIDNKNQQKYVKNISNQL